MSVNANTLIIIKTTRSTWGRLCRIPDDLAFSSIHMFTVTIFSIIPTTIIIIITIVFTRSCFHDHKRLWPFLLLLHLFTFCPTCWGSAWEGIFSSLSSARFHSLDTILWFSGWGNTWRKGFRGGWQWPGWWWRWWPRRYLHWSCWISWTQVQQKVLQ